jgi:hypothetical protein
MSGLLRRLASQTLMGGASPIHSQARLPFAGPLEWAQSGEVVSTPIVSTPQADVSQTSPIAEVPARLAEASTFQRPAKPSVVQASENVGKPNDNPIKPSKPVMEDRLAITKPMSISLANQQAVTQTSQNPTKPIVSVSIGNGALGGEQPVEVSQLQTMRGDGNPTLEVRHKGQASLPQPLLNTTYPPPRQEEKPGSPAAYPAGVSRSSQPKETTVNEVHVHIGRIEVTAMHDSPAPKRSTPATRRQPMSLEDYLNKRKGGAV